MQRQRHAWVVPLLTTWFIAWIVTGVFPIEVTMRGFLSNEPVTFHVSAIIFYASPIEMWFVVVPHLLISLIFAIVFWAIVFAAVKLFRSSRSTSA